MHRLVQPVEASRGQRVRAELVDLVQRREEVEADEREVEHIEDVVVLASNLLNGRNADEGKRDPREQAEEVALLVVPCHLMKWLEARQRTGTASSATLLQSCTVLSS